MPDIAFDLEPQPPMPFQAAADYEDAVLALARSVPDSVAYDLDIPYGPHRKHRFDAYYPAERDGAPVVLFLHGGGWTNGYKEYCRFMAEPVTSLGAILIAPAYRLVPEDRMPAPIDDMLALIQMLAQDTDFAGDMTRMILSGHSAGGHIAAMAALRLNYGDRVAPRPLGCAPISGIMDLHSDDPAPNSMEARVYDMVIGDPDEDIAMSPVGWTAHNRIPFVLHYGGRDSPRVIKSNARFAAALERQGCDVSFHIASGWDHFDTHTRLQDPNADWYGTISRMLTKEPSA